MKIEPDIEFNEGDRVRVNESYAAGHRNLMHWTGLEGTILIANRFGTNVVIMDTPPEGTDGTARFFDSELEPAGPPPVPAADHQSAQDAAPKHKPGHTLMWLAVLVLVIGGTLLGVGMSSTDAYGQHLPISPIPVLILVVAVVMAIMGLGRRIVSVLETRNS